MGHALQKSECVAVRRRPDKAFREKNRRSSNLGAYTLRRSGGELERSPSQVSANPDKRQGNASEYVKLGSQPFDQIAANSDTAFTEFETWIGAVPKNQLAIAVFSCLSLGALVGYHWSSLVNQTNYFNNPLKVNTVVPDAAKVDSTAAPVSLLPVATDPSLTAIADSSILKEQYLENEQQYLDEIDWLKSQNSTLQLEVDVLSQETLDQNRELLKLELDVAALQSQKEPPTETRVIYNFVNVPIGAAIDSQPTYSQDTGSTEYLEATDTTDEYVDDEERLLREWEDERTGYYNESEIMYDPETGYYINPNYSDESDDYQNGDDEGDEIQYPPIKFD